MICMYIYCMCIYIYCIIQCLLCLGSKILNRLQPPNCHVLHANYTLSDAYALGCSETILSEF